MSAFSESVRAEVVARAGGRCEDCRLPSRGQVGRFPIDHVIPRSRGGPTAIENLALSRPHCNAHKWSHADGIDPETGSAAPLFHPRMDRWDDHFRCSERDRALLEGISPPGRATIARLRLNHPDLVSIRRLMAALGLFPEVAG